MYSGYCSSLTGMYGLALSDRYEFLNYNLLAAFKMKIVWYVDLILDRI